MHVCMHSLTKHTHTYTLPGADFSSSCSFLLGTLKPIRVSLSLPPNPHFILFFPSLLFCYISCVSAFLPLSACVSDSPFSFHSQCSESVIKYFIMSLWTKWNLVLSSSCTYFFFLPTPVASQRLVLPPVSGMQPWCNTKCFSVLNLQVSGVLLNVDLFW